MAREFGSVLIYDGECPYCSVAANALERTDDIGAVSWYDDAVGPFLQAQYGAEPFAMVLVDSDRERVYAGRSAAEELTDRAGLPGLVGSLVRDNYDTIAKVVGLASNRGRDPDDYHGVSRLDDDARERYESVAAAASSGPLAST
jgi:predicted DCC family thiol-disulfide oxidoreductase YuxK